MYVVVFVLFNFFRLKIISFSPCLILSWLPFFRPVCVYAIRWNSFSIIIYCTSHFLMHCRFDYINVVCVYSVSVFFLIFYWLPLIFCLFRSTFLINVLSLLLIFVLCTLESSVRFGVRGCKWRIGNEEKENERDKKRRYLVHFYRDIS